MERNNKSARILVVDDTPSIFRLLMGIMQDTEYELLVATSGATAVVLAEEQQPDLILLDIQMPGMDGFEVCAILKSKAKTQAIPIIFLTAMTEENDEARGLELGAVDYIVKPFSPAILLARIKTHLALRAAHLQVERLNGELSRDHETVELILENLRRKDQFNPKNVRLFSASVDRSMGDIHFANFRSDGSQHLIVGDFTGHGLTAAVGGPVVSGLFHEYTAQGKDMDKIVSEVNTRLFEVLPPTMFMAGCFVEVNPNRNAVKIWNCGLPELFLFSSKGEKIKRIKSTHFPRGLLEDARDSEVAWLPMERGDCLYIYTDGLVEQSNGKGEIFGLERMESLLGYIVNQVPSIELNIIEKRIREFRGDQPIRDDMTLFELTF